MSVEAQKKNGWRETSSSPLNFVEHFETPHRQNYWHERLKGEILQLRSLLHDHPSDEILSQLDTVQIDHLDSTTYTNARNLLLELENLHQERRSRLQNVQEALVQIATRFQETVDWVTELNQLDLLSLVRTKVECAVIDLHAVLKALPPLPPGAQVQMKNEPALSLATVATKTPRKRGRTTGSRRKRKRETGEYYTIEKIVGYDNRPDDGIYYKIQWKGYPGQDTWEPEAEILAADAEDLILEYKRRWNETHPASEHWDIPGSAPILNISSGESSKPSGRRRRLKLRHRDSPEPKRGLRRDRDRFSRVKDILSRGRDTLSRNRNTSGAKDTPTRNRENGSSLLEAGDLFAEVRGALLGDRVAQPGGSLVAAEAILQNMDSVGSVGSINSGGYCAG